MRTDELQGKIADADAKIEEARAKLLTVEGDDLLIGAGIVSGLREYRSVLADQLAAQQAQAHEKRLRDLVKLKSQKRQDLVEEARKAQGAWDQWLCDVEAIERAADALWKRHRALVALQNDLNEKAQALDFVIGGDVMNFLSSGVAGRIKMGQGVLLWDRLSQALD